MISLAQFIQDKQGQALLYPPNSEEYRGQCFQLIQYYVTEVWGTPPIWKPYAYQIMQADPNHYLATYNDPNDPNQVPPVGAVLVWGAALPGSGGAGHTAIYITSNGNHTFTSFDTNWGGRTAHYVSHNWTNLLGWITPKQSVVLASATTPTTNGENEMIETDDQATKMYKLLRPNGTPSDGEIQSTTNKRTYASFVNDAQNEVVQRDANLAAQAQHLAEQQDLINQQNATITELTTSGTKSKDDYDAAIAKIADLNAQLATKHDVLADLSAKVNSVVTSDQPAVMTNTPSAEVATVKGPNWVTSFFMWALSRKKKS